MISVSLELQMTGRQEKQIFLPCRIQDNGGWTPIIWAAEHKHVEVIKSLLNRGADVSVSDKVIFYSSVKWQQLCLKQTEATETQLQNKCSWMKTFQVITLPSPFLPSRS